MYRQILLLSIFLISYISFSFSQKVYMSHIKYEDLPFSFYGGTVFNEYDQNKCDQNPEICTFDYINTRSITHHADGYFYFYGNKMNGQVLDISREKAIWRADIKNCTIIDTFDIPFGFSSAFHIGITSNHVGDIYYTIIDDASQTSSLVHFDLNTKVHTVLGIIKQNYLVGDIIFYNGNLYGLYTNPQMNTCGIFAINILSPTNSEIIYTIEYEGVSNQSFRAIGSAIIEVVGNCNTIDYFTNRSFPSILNIILQGDANIVCDSIGSNGLGAVKPYNYLGSEKQCELLLDLDRDNSSRIYPYDFVNTAVRCKRPYTAHIADADAYIRSTGMIDSLSIRFIEIFDQEMERLYPPEQPGGFSWHVLPHGYTIKNPVGATDSLWADYLSRVLYHHEGEIPTDGERIIEIAVYSEGTSTTARSYIPVYKVAYAGTDSELSVCSSTLSQNLLALTGGHEGGYWQPSLSGGGDEFDAGRDIGGMYKYIVDTGECGSDTAEVDIRIYPSRKLDLADTVSLCPEISIELRVSSLATDSILWSDGVSGAMRTVSDPGVYEVTVITIENCRLTDSVTVLRSDTPIITQSYRDICEYELIHRSGTDYYPGDTIVHLIQQESACDSLQYIYIRGMITPVRHVDSFICSSATIEFEGMEYYAGDVYSMRIGSSEGCDTMIIVQLHSYPLVLPELNIPLQTQVCPGGSIYVSSDITEGIEWSTGSTEPGVSLSAGKYRLSYTDENSCTNTVEFIIFESEKPELEYEIKAAPCMDETGQLTVTQGVGTGSLRYELEGRTYQTPKNHALLPGSYEISYMNEEDCKFKDTLVVTYEAAGLEIEMDTLIRMELRESRGIDVEIKRGNLSEVRIIPDTNIRWEITTLYVKGINNRIYEIEFTDSTGCKTYRILRVEVDDSSISLRIPNAIRLQPERPENGSLYLIQSGISYDLEVYDRWGGMIYQAAKITGGDHTAGWRPSDGKVGPGVYVYKITVHHSDMDKKVIFGTVSVF